MRKMRRLHIAVALLTVASIVSLLGTALVGIRASPEEWVSIFAVKPVHKTVWYRAAIDSDGVIVSPSMHNSWGRGRLHLLMEGWGLTGTETITFRVLAPLWNPAKTAYIPILVATYTVTATDKDRDVSLDVPMNQFYFSAAGTPGDQASLSFYLSL